MMGMGPHIVVICTGTVKQTLEVMLEEQRVCYILLDLHCMYFISGITSFTVTLNYTFPYNSKSEMQTLTQN